MFITLTLQDWVGYAAMAFVSFAYLMKNINSLRIVNSIGALLFVIYGFMLRISWPIVITNAFILIVNIWYLMRGKYSD